MSTNKLAYVELPAANTAAMKAFYGALFGWSFQIGAPTTRPSLNPEWMAASMQGDEHRTKAPLLIVETADIHAMEERVQNAGGTITVPTFSFPGGRRFHFMDPSGNELAVMQLD